MKFNAKRFLGSVSRSCGVYAMKDEGGAYLYIGKANNLKNRLTTHLRPSQLSHRFAAVMRQLASIETIVTRNETEALLLENNLIKEHKPRYNINLRDDKSYPYIHLDLSHDYPGLRFYRGNRKEAGRFFGPFSSASAVRNTLSQLQKAFPVRQCRDSYFRHRSRPCLQFQINRCSGPCVGHIDQMTYMEDVEQVIDFLSGRNHKLQEMLMSRMDQAVAELEFETAAKFRDRITAVQRLLESQQVDGGESDTDVIAVEKAGSTACIALTSIRSGRNVDHRSFFPKLAIQIDEIDILAEFVPRYYLSHQCPPLILVDNVFPEMDLISRALGEQNGRRIEIRRPQRGAKRKLIQLAQLNARDSIRRRNAQTESMDIRMESLARSLRLEQPPGRIECFDISHMAGDKTVASCVVFDPGGALKSEYRRMNISDIEPGDDYAAMRQALHRRYRKARESEIEIPDLVLIDGGTGQLQVAVDVFDELQISEIQLIAISKGKQRKPGCEQLWTPGVESAIDVEPDALLMLQKIRDEAHRFALLGHRSRLAKSRRNSTLEDIPGIGARRRSHLLKHFGGLQGLSRAGIDELTDVPGISAELAEKIYYSFHGPN